MSFGSFLAVFRCGVLLLLVLPALPLRAEDDVLETIESINLKIQANPTNGRLFVQRSKLYSLQKNFDQALADLDQANRLMPLPEIEREKAQVYFNAGWYETGIDHVNHYLAGFSEDPEGYLLRARLNAKLDHRADAGADYDLAIQRFKQQPLDLYIEQAQVRTTEDGAYLTDALRMLQSGIQRAGPIITLQSAALEIELRQQNYDAALARVDDIASHTPRKDLWLARRGDILAQAGRVDDARLAYQQALDAIGKLIPAQREQAATKGLETQLKSLLEKSSNSGTNSPASAGTSLLASAPAQTNPPPAVSSAPTNEPALPPGGKIRTYFIAA